MNATLVVANFLEHFDPTVPALGPDKWTWMKGSLSCTIDRSWGILDLFHHHSQACHVVHHLFSDEVPCYNAVKATVALRAHLEPKGLYNCNPESWWKATWHSFKRCHYVEAREGVQWTKSLEDISCSRKPSEFHCQSQKGKKKK
jgi:omega-6 fatty acid desaturase (delta-12 desaturase)